LGEPRSLLLDANCCCWMRRWRRTGVPPRAPSQSQRHSPHPQRSNGCSSIPVNG